MSRTWPSAAQSSGDPALRAADSRDALAALDLGSNSFHMVIGRLDHEELVVEDRLREQVQLAAGLDADGNIDEEARERALGCLARFGQRLRGLPRGRVRAVGTRTLRVAKDNRDFRRAAKEALGHPIEVVSGQEEARLIYLGIAHTLSDDAGTRLVVDIGGGSTEVILGERFEVVEAHSLSMGCVVFSQRFFPDGKLSSAAFEAAMSAAHGELQTMEARFRDIGWTGSVGASGTIRAAAAVIKNAGWSKNGITAPALKKLRRAMIDAGRVEKLSLSGLKDDRAPVFAGGVAILSAVFQSLGLERMDSVRGALREGVLYDLLGRIRHEDVRERTIAAFQERYHVDRAQAARVGRTALAALDQVASAWGLEQEAKRFLSWAARLHEVGRAVAYDHHQRHGAYLIHHADMAGFSRDDQLLLAAVVGNQRRKPVLDLLADVPRKSRRRLAVRLILLLRLAIVFHRIRSPQPSIPARLVAEGETVRLDVDRVWLDDHGQTRVDLAAQIKTVRAFGLALSCREVDRDDL